METWAYHEIAALVDMRPEYELTQYRDSDKREIDFMVKGDDDELLGIEVKSGTVGDGDFKHLKWFASHLARGRFTGIVLYSGLDVLSFGRDMFAVPLSMLAI